MPMSVEKIPLVLLLGLTVMCVSPDRLSPCCYLNPFSATRRDSCHHKKFS